LLAREFVFGLDEAESVAGELATGEFAAGGFSSAEFLREAGAEFAFELAAFEDRDGFVTPGAEKFSVAEEEALELVGLGTVDLDERRIRRGTKMIARTMAAAILTRKSLLERGSGLGEMTRRALPMVALTCGSEVTGIGTREGCGGTLRDALGETGESGTASGSISGSGWRSVARERTDADVAEGGSTEAIKASGELGASGGRIYGESTGAGSA
jgi:hypothetical protein